MLRFPPPFANGPDAPKKNPTSHHHTPPHSPTANPLSPLNNNRDDSIIRLVSTHGTKKWSVVASTLSATSSIPRSGKQCRTRWLNHLDPDIKKEPWTEEEVRHGKVVFSALELVAESAAGRARGSHVHAASSLRSSPQPFSFAPRSLSPPPITPPSFIPPFTPPRKSTSTKPSSASATNGLRSPSSSPAEPTTPLKTTGTPPCAATCAASRR